MSVFNLGLSVGCGDRMSNSVGSKANFNANVEKDYQVWITNQCQLWVIISLYHHWTPRQITSREVQVVSKSPPRALQPSQHLRPSTIDPERRAHFIREDMLRNTTQLNEELGEMQGDLLVEGRINIAKPAVARVAASKGTSRRR